MCPDIHEHNQCLQGTYMKEDNLYGWSWFIYPNLVRRRVVYETTVPQNDFWYVYRMYDMYTMESLFQYWISFMTSHKSVTCVTYLQQAYNMLQCTFIVFSNHLCSCHALWHVWHMTSYSYWCHICDQHKIWCTFIYVTLYVTNDVIWWLHHIWNQQKNCDILVPVTICDKCDKIVPCHTVWQLHIFIHIINKI
jgi:hypothetical protein